MKQNDQLLTESYNILVQHLFNNEFIDKLTKRERENLFQVLNNINQVRAYIDFKE